MLSYIREYCHKRIFLCVLSFLSLRWYDIFVTVEVLLTLGSLTNKDNSPDSSLFAIHQLMSHSPPRYPPPPHSSSQSSSAHAGRQRHGDTGLGQRVAELLSADWDNSAVLHQTSSHTYIDIFYDGTKIIRIAKVPCLINLWSFIRILARCLKGFRI